MFEINDILFDNKLNEKVRLTGVEFDPSTEKMMYIVESKEHDRIERSIYDLSDIRYNQKGGW